MAFFFFPHMATKRPFWHWKAMNFTITWVREKISLLFVCEMTSDRCHDHTMHYLNVRETERWAEGVELYNPRLCCYSTDKPVKRGPVWAGHHCSWLLFLSLQGPILYTCHVLLPLPWPNFFWKPCFPNCRKSRCWYKSFQEKLSPWV